MKHLVSTLLLAGSLGLATAAQAQVQVSLGPRVGENLSTHRLDADDATSAYRFGLAAGVQASLSWKKFALQPALLFSQKGSSVSEELLFSTNGGTLQAGTFTTKVRLSYLTLPLNFVFAPAGTGTGPQVFAGPYLGVLLGGRLEQSYPPDLATSGPVYVVGNGDIPSAPGYYSNRFDAGVQGGVGFRFEHLLLQAEYSLGLRNQFPAYSTNPLVPNRTEYNRSFQASVSYLFDLKH